MEPPRPSPSDLPWSAAQRFLFRLSCCYWLLYLLPFPLNQLPYLGVLATPWVGLWSALVPWVGKTILGVVVIQQPTGSGDTMFAYVQLACFVVLALLAALAWTLLDPRRPHYRRLMDWLRAYLRLSVATTMISYGAVKVIKSQFAGPTLDRLLQPFGDASPMGLLWTFMAASEPYNVFTGLGEMVGGLLLTTRRTTLLGSLVTAGVMTHVVALNFSYDVPVKLFSLHLVLAALFLALPDWRRLLHFFVAQRATEARPLPALFSRPKWHRGALAVRTIYVLAMVALSLNQAQQMRSSYGDGAPKSPFRGVWNVVELEVDGEARPPLLSDETRWRRVIFDYPRWFGIQRMNDHRQNFTVKLDEEKMTMEVSLRLDPSWGSTILSYEREGPDVMILSGPFEKQRIKARLVRQPERDFLLLSRGFHWVAEQPFNR